MPSLCYRWCPYPWGFLPGSLSPTLGHGEDGGPGPADPSPPLTQADRPSHWSLCLPLRRDISQVPSDSLFPAEATAFPADMFPSIPGPDSSSQPSSGSGISLGMILEVSSGDLRLLLKRSVEIRNAYFECQELRAGGGGVSFVF